eukprot:TRINITY_DN6209_c0_g4_i1.p1 TRINITY_DN6209_c0_g4~~TRINITY_DN6209_c0_g4_i1.p1  ORF type:complete len:142 (-),score=23.51 TRINITY_DN6209_c0_g4_i1:92-517(-)
MWRLILGVLGVGVASLKFFSQKFLPVSQFTTESARTLREELRSLCASWKDSRGQPLPDNSPQINNLIKYTSELGVLLDTDNISPSSERTIYVLKKLKKSIKTLLSTSQPKLQPNLYEKLRATGLLIPELQFSFTETIYSFR